MIKGRNVLYRGYVYLTASAAWLQWRGVDVNQPRAKASTTGSTGYSCATEHRRLAGGGVGVTTGGRRAS